MDTFLNILGNIIFIVSIIFTIGWCFQIREKARIEQATEKTFELQGLLLTISVILIPVLSLSQFHLIWMIPTSFLLGLLSVYFPLRLLWVFSSFYFSFWYIGINNIGRSYYLSGEYAKAINAYKEQIIKKPTSSALHFNLGLTYGKSGQYVNEIASYKEAIRLKPDAPEMHFNLGIAYNEIGNKEKAIAALKNAIYLRPNYNKAHYYICKIYIEIGDRENALKEYEFLKNTDSTIEEELGSIIKNLGTY